MSDGRKRKIVHGYIRNHIDKKDELNIPDSIKHLCTLFLSLWFDIVFNWDPFRGDDHIAAGTSIDGPILQFAGAGH